MKMDLSASVLPNMKAHPQRSLVVSVILLIATAASAQNFAIDWYLIGSGGTSTGGGYSLTGSAGLPEAGTTSGGAYSIEAGVWDIQGQVAVPEIIFDNTSGSVNGGVGVTADTWLASKFCLGAQGYVLDSLSLLLNSQDYSGAAGPPCAVQLRIYSNDPVTGKPYADTGVTMNLSGFTNPITLLGGQQLVKWIPATPLKLSAGSCYWAVLSAENNKRLGQIASFSQPTGPAATLGQTRSIDAGATWQAPDNSSNFKMVIQATPSATPVGLNAIAGSRAGADLLLSFVSVAGQTYTIQKSSDLWSGIWETLPGAPTTGVGGPVAVAVSNAFIQPQQYYRVKVAP